MNAARASAPLSWFGIARLGLVQASLGAIVVITTSTLNRVMVVELALAASLPGLLVGLHYAVQLLRPRWGHGSDVGGRRTPWIVGGMAALAAGAVLAALATALAATNLVAGIALSTLAFGVIGIGVGASGTSLLALLAERVAPARQASAAAIVWIMMIAGFIVTAGTAGHFLDPFSMTRLVAVTAGVAGIAFLVTILAVAGVEGARRARSAGASGAAKVPFRQALAEVWAEPTARRFTIFVFVSMLAYSAQDLILEPFAGAVFAMTPGETTQLSGVQNGGVLVGMILTGLLGGGFREGGRSRLHLWAIGGCLISAAALAGLAFGGALGAASFGAVWPLHANVAVLGFGNGVFAVAAIGSMMRLAREGAANREGTRVGLWGAAQGVAFGLGGLVGTIAVDVGRLVLDGTAEAYAGVFLGEAVLFIVSAVLAARVMSAGALAPAGGRGAAAIVRAQPVLQGRTTS
ncbi:BCD family MFS transporter [Salinarimonas ramus]|uniref:Bacteriochlorophyll synthase n=1 Tax=Salinarimonas ramus TaxID=690164 RepID=A0A917QKQ3_9HYPH|nr:BCD family MFS transporter [Salinarimonas ramus]GGK55082.1 bacteriochlorophyll synthase [Salinarimonas ramus]